jgi:hypothetical protein
MLDSMSLSSLSVRPSQLLEILKVTIPAGLPILIKGAPGVGKSDIIAQVCNTLGVNLMIDHPVVSDPTDYKGLPYAGPDGKATFLPFGSLQKLIDAKVPTVYFLDDLGQAPQTVQAACMQLILARRINGYHVSPFVTFMAATNRHTDRAGVTGILEPVKSRWSTILELVPDMNDWTQWALTAGLPTELIAFIRFRPELLWKFAPTNEIKNTPCPRTVNNVGKLMQAKIPPHLEYVAFTGAAGEEFAAEFSGFLRIFRSLPNPDAVLMNPDSAEVPTDPATLYAICGALARRAGDNSIERLVSYANRLPDEFSVLLINDSYRLAPEIANSRTYIDWCAKHNDVMI